MATAWHDSDEAARFARDHSAQTARVPTSAESTSHGAYTARGEPRYAQHVMRKHRSGLRIDHSL